MKSLKNNYRDYSYKDHKGKQLFDYIQEIEALIAEEKPPECIHKNTCKKCAYYEYCYI